MEKIQIVQALFAIQLTELGKDLLHQIKQQKKMQIHRSLLHRMFRSNPLRATMFLQTSKVLVKFHNLTQINPTKSLKNQ